MRHSSKSPKPTTLKQYAICGVDANGSTPLGIMIAASLGEAETLAEREYGAWPATHAHLLDDEGVTRLRTILKERGTAPKPVQVCHCGKRFTPVSRDHTVCDFACAMRMTPMELLVTQHQRQRPRLPQA